MEALTFTSFSSSHSLLHPVITFSHLYPFLQPVTQRRKHEESGAWKGNKRLKSRKKQNTHKKTTGKKNTANTVIFVLVSFFITIICVFFSRVRRVTSLVLKETPVIRQILESVFLDISRNQMNSVSTSSSKTPALGWGELA